MNLADTKIELTKLLLKNNDKGILDHIRAILETNSEDWWSELLDGIKASVESGLKQSARKQRVSHELVMKKYENG
jgi:hypothetical protein